MGKAKRHADGSNPAVVTSGGNLISLGYPGEFWRPAGLDRATDGALIPIPGTEIHIAIVFDYVEDGKYSVVCGCREEHVDNLLMLSCLVREIYDGVQTHGLEYVD